jgi:galactokinase
MSRNGPHSVYAPGRVNLIGDHVDYVGGLVLPMAVDLGTTIEMVARGGQDVVLRSSDEPAAVRLKLPVGDHDEETPPWGRFEAAVLAELQTVEGFEGAVSTSLPIGAGMSSSSSLSVAVALAAGFDGTPLELARLCRLAETAATGVPCGIMDQLTIAAAMQGAALAIDCRDETFRSVPLPEASTVFAVHCGVSRRLIGSAYAERRASCEIAESQIGALRDSSLRDVARLKDPTIRARARHVVTEIGRVEAAIEACENGDSEALGRLMVESHQSLRDDFEVSIEELDTLVEQLRGIDGVHGARLTGAGFGGCVVVLANETVDLGAHLPDSRCWRLSPSGGARVT